MIELQTHFKVLIVIIVICYIIHALDPKRRLDHNWWTPAGAAVIVWLALEAICWLIYLLLMDWF